VSEINQDEQASESFTVSDVVVNQGNEFFLLFFTYICKSVSGEIDQVPIVVDQKVVDKQGFTRFGAHFGQIAAIGQ
jgi:hypothetical protein